jgi:hypothetical protein
VRNVIVEFCGEVEDQFVGLEADFGQADVAALARHRRDAPARKFTVFQQHFSKTQIIRCVLGTVFVEVNVDPHHRTRGFHELGEEFFVFHLFVKVVGGVFTIDVDLIVAAGQQEDDFFVRDSPILPHYQVGVGELVRGESQLDVETVLGDVINIKFVAFLPFRVDV